MHVLTLIYSMVANEHTQRRCWFVRCAEEQGRVSPSYIQSCIIVVITFILCLVGCGGNRFFNREKGRLAAGFGFKIAW